MTDAQKIADAVATAEASLKDWERKYGTPRMNTWAYLVACLLDAVKAQTEPGGEEWEYAQSEILDDGTTAFGHPVSTLDEAIRRRDLDRVNYPWPEDLGVGRRRKAGPWEPVSPKKGQDQ